MSKVVNEFDLAWARYWLKKYRKRHKMKEARLVAQLIEHQEFFGNISILSKDLVIEGSFSFELLKKVLEVDLNYKLNNPKTLLDYYNSCNKKFFCKRIVINFS